MAQRASDPSDADVMMVERNGRFFFFQPDVGVIASDTQIEIAYSKFCDARRAFWNEVAESGLTAGRQGADAAPWPSGREIVAVAGPGSSRGVGAELGMFVAKLCIALVLVGGLGAIVGARVAGGIAMALQQVGPSHPISLADVSQKSADIVKDIQSLTKEQKDTLLRSVSAISRELDPVVDAWRNPQPPR